ncbi:MAG: aldose 1-epimerase [Fidelibacterota bacterium]
MNKKFEIKETRKNNLKTIRLINHQSGEYISIVPDYGANVNEMVLEKKGKLYSIIKGYRTKEEFDNHDRFYNAPLFPFAGRLPEGIYHFDGKSYQFDINDRQLNAALHGFLYNQPMKLESEIIKKHKAAITFVFNTEKFTDSYPFSLKISIKYTLSEKGFTSQTTIENQGDRKAPAAYGVHPYFRFDKKVDELKMMIPTEKETVLNKQLVPLGEIKANSEFIMPGKIRGRVFDNGFQFPRQERIMNTELTDETENCTINIWQETGSHKFNFLLIYTPPDRESIAIEPLSGNINSLNSGDDLMILNPGQSATLSWGVYLK